MYIDGPILKSCDLEIIIRQITIKQEAFTNEIHKHSK